MIEISLPLMAAQIATFVIALYIVWRYGWRQILRLIERRQTAIRESMQEAEQTRQTAAELEKEYRLRLSQVQQQSAQVLAISRLQGEQAKAGIVKQAQQEIEALRRKAQEQMELERGDAAQALRAEAARLSLVIAERLLRRSAGPAIQEQRLQEVVREIEAGAGPKAAS